MAPSTCTIGYPRIGAKREMKKSLESYWKSEIKYEELVAVEKETNTIAWKEQKAAGVDHVGLDGTMYDQILDMIQTLGLAPERFQHLEGPAKYFAMARGTQDAPALDMSKYFNTNYHFLVPEVSEKTAPKLNAEVLLNKVQNGQQVIGKDAAIPMIVGPVTMARLANLENITIPALVEKLIPVYSELLQNLNSLGVPEVQVLEPALCFYDASKLQSIFEGAYQKLTGTVPLHLVTFYDDIGDAYSWAVKLPVAAISLDFIGVSGAAFACRTLDMVLKNGFPADKRLGAGVIDGRNVWADNDKAAVIIKQLKAAGIVNIAVQPSCSLQHVPIDLELETKLDATVKSRLAFSRQKLVELVQTANGVSTGTKASATATTPLAKPSAKWFDRPAPYSSRRTVQEGVHPELPAFPTTTIGSFPQTKNIRKARADLKVGRIDDAEYTRQMDGYIAHMIGVQEGLGLDVLVHGEPERSDMVEFFGHYMEGITFSQHAWVQSYGSRYVRPPIIYGDVTRPVAMTVREFQYAQSLTSRPVKGMLTGPVTILNWSFPRNDIPRSVTAFQLALAVRAEVADLESAGCTIIQVDEPALREGLPLKQEQWDSYLEWAVDAFRLTCGVAAPATQIVTHLCYSDFGDILPAIDRMDADVLTIENSRSGNEMMLRLKDGKYARDIGPGVYDVHSPVVPTVDFLTDKISGFMSTGILDSNAKHIWVNPDCGLKTRDWKEVIPSLRNLVEAAVRMRTKFNCEATPMQATNTNTVRACC